MIKVASRRNMRYLFFLFVFHNLRITERIIMKNVTHFSDTLTLMILMFLGELLGGLIIIIYQYYSFSTRKKIDANIDFIDIENSNKYELIHEEIEMKNKKNIFKILLLIFFASFFQFSEFIISGSMTSIAILSPTTDQRLYIIVTFTSSFLCIFALKIKTGKHHTFSLIGMGVCSLIIFIIELIYKSKETSFGYLLLIYLLVFCELIFVSFTDVIEKYLTEFNNSDKYHIISVEGLYGIFLCLIYALSMSKNPINKISKIYNELGLGGKILFIIFLFLYAILSAGLNTYKIICNVIYNPMVKSLAGFFLNPLLIFYYFINENDFISKGNRNYFYFFINIILSLTINFFACIYNEVFILSCFSLKKDTHLGITERSKKNATTELQDLDQDTSLNSLSSRE